MRAVRPRGPCFVGGWSAGGAIGYEIGQQLLAQGEDVALVVLFDTRTLALSPGESRRRRDVDRDSDGGHQASIPAYGSFHE